MECADRQPESGEDEAERGRGTRMVIGSRRVADGQSGSGGAPRGNVEEIGGEMRQEEG